MEFCRFLEPTEEEAAARSAATARVAGVITAIWPDAVVEAFGSYATGLYLPTSDMDLVVTSSGVFWNAHATYVPSLAHFVLHAGVIIRVCAASSWPPCHGVSGCSRARLEGSGCCKLILKLWAMSRQRAPLTVVARRVQAVKTCGWR